MTGWNFSTCWWRLDWDLVDQFGAWWANQYPSLQTTLVHLPATRLSLSWGCWDSVAVSFVGRCCLSWGQCWKSITNDSINWLFWNLHDFFFLLRCSPLTTRSGIALALLCCQMDSVRYGPLQTTCWVSDSLSSPSFISCPKNYWSKLSTSEQWYNNCMNFILQQKNQIY